MAAGARGRRGGAEQRGGGKSEGWSGRSNDASDSETEEDGMPAGKQEWGYNTRTALPWDKQENGAGGLRVDEQTGGSNGRKDPSAKADKAGTRGRNGER